MRDASHLEDAGVDARRVCAWCRRRFEGKRRDAKTCSKKCRQAAHRFRVGRAPAATTRPMRFAYADPPYPGLARRYYGCPEVDHAELVARLVREFPDGWALSTSTAALPSVLELARAAAWTLSLVPRVAAWVRGSRRSVANRARNAWEPVIVVGGRPRRLDVAEVLDDVLLWGGRQHSHPDALVGMKPAAFCEWMFRLLGAELGDDLVDVFPGSGAVGRAWQLYTSRGDRGATLPSRLAGAATRLEAL